MVADWSSQYPARWFEFIIALFICLVPIHAQAQDDTVYAITPTDSTFLKYYSVCNVFDSATVRYEFGEVRHRTNGTYERVYFSTMLEVRQVTANGPAPGVQSDLQAKLQTQSFYLAYNTDTIAFYRNLSLMLVTHAHDNEPLAWKIHDRSQFLVELVRQSDNVVIAVLDSVNMDSASLGTPLGAVTGTSPGNFCRKAFVPFGVRACSAYVRVTPIRNGAGVSSYGMNAMTFVRPYSLSSTWSCNGYMPDSLHNITMRTRFFEKLIEYLDEYYTSTCELPIRNQHYYITSEQADSIISRYYQLCTVDGLTAYRLIPCSSPKAPVSCKNEITKEIQIISISSIPGQITLSVDCSRPSATDIVVYDLTGHNASGIQQRLLPQGSTKEVLNVDLAAGTYVVGIRNSRTGHWSFGKVLMP